MRTISSAMGGCLLLLIAGTTQAEWSANIGFASDYYFRGVFQGSSSASGGVDFEENGFYAGTWAAQVGEGNGNGLEVDAYFGYAGEIDDISYSLGYTGYFYTGDFDDTYQEISLGGGYGVLTLDLAVGQYEAFDAPTLDYVYYAVTLEKNGFYGRYAGFSRDFDGAYFELGYGTSVAGIDVGIAVISSNDDLVGQSEESLVFTIGKTFDL